jgi:hypothetical protein
MVSDPVPKSSAAKPAIHLALSILERTGVFIYCTCSVTLLECEMFPQVPVTVTV